LKRETIFKRAEKYNQEYLKAQRDIIDAKRAAKRDNSLFVPAESRLVFVVRIKGYDRSHYVRPGPTDKH